MTNIYYELHNIYIYNIHNTFIYIYIYIYKATKHDENNELRN